MFRLNIWLNIRLNIKPRTYKNISLFMLTLSLILVLSAAGVTITENRLAAADVGFGESPDWERPYENSRVRNVSGIYLHYRLWKPETDEIKGQLLLVHGLGGSTFSWRQQIKPLKEAGFLIAAVDLPAFGYSDRQRDLKHTPENRASWLWELLETLESTGEISSGKNWHLAGHSMGGGVVTAMAHQRPERADSLILAAAALERSDTPGNSWLEYSLIRSGFQFVLRQILFRERVIARALSSAYGRSPAPEELEAYLEPLKLAGTAAAWLDVTRTVENFPREKVEEINLPVLLLWGEEDSWVELEDGKEYADFFPNSTFITIEEAAHLPMETHPEEFNRHLLDWLVEFNSS